MNANNNTIILTNRWWSFIWGNGHTADTLPTNRGWRAELLSKGSKTLLVGRRGRMGCFSVQQWPDGVLDVAVYYDTPEYVADSLKEGVGIDAYYQQVEDCGGWGLSIVEKIEREIDTLEDF